MYMLHLNVGEPEPPVHGLSDDRDLAGVDYAFELVRREPEEKRLPGA